MDIFHPAAPTNSWAAHNTMAAPLGSGYGSISVMCDADSELKSVPRYGRSLRGLSGGHSVADLNKAAAYIVKMERTRWFR